MPKTNWEKLGFDKCTDAYGNLSYEKLGKAYLNLFAKELKASAQKGEQLVQRIGYTQRYDDNLTCGEENILKTIVNRINEKYKFDDLLHEHGIHFVKPYDLMSYNSNQDIEKAIYSNMNQKDSCTIALNRLSFVSKNKSIFEGRNVDETTEEMNKQNKNTFLVGSMKELDKSFKSISFFQKLMHPIKYYREKQEYNKVRDSYTRALLNMRKDEPLTKLLRDYANDYSDAILDDYSRVTHEFEGAHLNYRSFFPLKTFAEEYKPAHLETDAEREERLAPSNDFPIDMAKAKIVLDKLIFKENASIKEENKEVYRKPIEAVEVKNDVPEVDKSTIDLAPHKEISKDINK